MKTITKKHLYDLFAGQLNLNQLLIDAGNLVLQSTNCESFIINLYDQDKTNLVVEAVSLSSQYKALEGSIMGYQMPLSRSDPNIEACQTDNSIFVDRKGLDSYDEHLAGIFNAWRIRHLLVIPIHFQGNILGTFQAISHKKSFEKGETGKISTIIDQVAPYIFMAHEYEIFKRKEEFINHSDRQRREMVDIISKLSHIYDLDEIYKLILTELMNYYKFHIGSIHRLCDDMLRPKCWTARTEGFEKPISRMIKWAEKNPASPFSTDGALSSCFANNTYMYLTDATHLKRLPMTQRDRAALKILGDVRTIVFIPIRQGTRPIGVIWLSSLSEVVNLNSDDQAVLESIGTYLGTVFENAEMYAQIDKQHHEIEKLNNELQRKVEKLHQMATHDSLTGLYNFGYFQKALDSLISEKDRRNPELNDICLVIADIDYFKQFNDSHGHEAGNIALKHVSDIIQELARDTDIVCRYGGEEFTILLPRCDLEGARQFAERVRYAIETTPVIINDTPHNITISLGCSICQEGESARACVSRADDELYKAKRNGRNRVEASE